MADLAPPALAAVAPASKQELAARAAPEGVVSLAAVDFRFRSSQENPPSPVLSCCAQLRNDAAALKECDKNKKLPSTELLHRFRDGLAKLSAELSTPVEEERGSKVQGIQKALDKALKAYKQLTEKAKYSRADLEEIVALDGPRNKRDVWHALTLTSLKSNSQAIIKGLPELNSAIAAVENKEIANHLRVASK